MEWSGSGIETPILFGSREVDFQNKDDNHEYVAIAFKPALVYSVYGVEVGATFTTGVDQKSDPADGVLGKEIPAEFAAHGRVKLDDFLSVGALYEYSWVAGLGDATENLYRLAATGEYDLGKAKFEAILGFHSDKYLVSPTSPDHIAYMDFAVAGDYWLTDLASMGASVQYEYGVTSDNKARNFSRNQFSFGLRGNYLF